MPGTRLTDLDFKLDGPRFDQRHRLRKRLAPLFYGVVLIGLVIGLARAPQPASLVPGEAETGHSEQTLEIAAIGQPADAGKPEKPLPDNRAQKTGSAEQDVAVEAHDANVGDSSNQPGGTFGGRDWQTGALLDSMLPMPRLHDIATGELLVFKRIVELAPNAEPDYQRVTVRSGDSLSAIFSRAGISAQETHRVINADDRVRALRRIYPGDELLFHVDDEGRLQSLRYAMDNVRTLVVERHPEDGFSTRIVEEVLETRVVEASGTIDRSLFVSARRAGLSQRQVMQFMSIFEWQLDFNRDIRRGDAFSVVYEAEFLDDEQVSDGRILAAKLINGSRRHTALRFEQEDGTVGYYGANGENLRKAFIRRPVQNARISSGFDRNRMHPVLGHRRPHLGTDFAAPTGTPIMASGAGRVVHVGRKGGYGHTVIIQHNNRYRTLYAHMSRYADGLRNGSRVEQGEVIGYVGRSGLATGPHLHYEFLVEGNHYDPMAIDLPTGDPIPSSQMTAFRQHTAGALAQLQDGTETQLAARDQN